MSSQFALNLERSGYNQLLKPTYQSFSHLVSALSIFSPIAVSCSPLLLRSLFPDVTVTGRDFTSGKTRLKSLLISLFMSFFHKA